MTRLLIQYFFLSVMQDQILIIVVPATQNKISQQHSRRLAHAFLVLIKDRGYHRVARMNAKESSEPTESPRHKISTWHDTMVVGRCRPFRSMALPPPRGWCYRRVFGSNTFSTAPPTHRPHERLFAGPTPELTLSVDEVRRNGRRSVGRCDSASHLRSGTNSYRSLRQSQSTNAYTRCVRHWHMFANHCDVVQFVGVFGILCMRQNWGNAKAFAAGSHDTLHQNAVVCKV